MEAGTPRAPDESIPEAAAADREVTEDVQRLHEMGYKQELARAWSGFTNFAISFTIISVLAGTFTTFFQAWNSGGPIAVSIGWPVLCVLVLMVAFSMAELTSAFPTAGGPYWWSAKLGGASWSWFTGWFNIAGLIGIVASVGYGAAFFMDSLFAFYGLNVLGVNFGDDVHVLTEIFLLYLIILGVVTLLNIFADPILGMINNISVGWHVLGVAVIIGLLAFVPDDHQDLGFVFGERLNNTGFDGGANGGFAFWFLVLPLGFLLAMYTQTGYDASAHTAEETRGAAKAAAQGVWRSVFFSALIGWLVLLAFLFAANDVGAVNDAGGGVIAIFESALDSWAAKMVVLIATVGQIFCVTAGLTSASRTWYAFSRDRAIPGWPLFRRLNRDRVPLFAVMAVSFFSLVITIPALWSNAAGIAWAFPAITGICTVGLYLAYIIPVYLRHRAGDSFQPGPWNLGRRYKLVNRLAMAFVVLVVISLSLPFTHASVPWNDDFDITTVNYSPLVLVLGLVVAVWWAVSAKDKYTGPVRTLEEDEVTAD